MFVFWCINHIRGPAIWWKVHNTRKHWYVSAYESWKFSTQGMFRIFRHLLLYFGKMCGESCFRKNTEETVSKLMSSHPHSIDSRVNSNHPDFFDALQEVSMVLQNVGLTY